MRKGLVLGGPWDGREATMLHGDRLEVATLPKPPVSWRPDGLELDAAFEASRFQYAHTIFYGGGRRDFTFGFWVPAEIPDDERGEWALNRLISRYQPEGS